MGGKQTSSRRITTALVSAMYFVGGATVVFMMIYIVGNALSRTLLGAPFFASLEIVQYILMPGLAAVGFVAATVAHRHVSADIIFGYFAPFGRKWLAVANLFLSVAALAVLVGYTWKEAVFALSRDFKAGYTDIPVWPLYFAISISLLIMALLFARDAWIAARGPVEPDAPAPGHESLETASERQSDLIQRAKASGEIL